MNAENSVIHVAEIRTYFVQTESGVFYCNECGKIFITNGKDLVVMQRAIADDDGKFREVGARHTFAIPVGLTRMSKAMITGEELYGKILFTNSVEMIGGETQGLKSDLIGVDEISKVAGIPDQETDSPEKSAERLKPFDVFLEMLDSSGKGLFPCTP